MTLTERREKLLTDWRTALGNVQAATQQLDSYKARVTGLEAQIALLNDLITAETVNGSTAPLTAIGDPVESLP